MSLYGNPDVRLPTKVRWFVVTNWNMDTDYPEVMQKNGIRFVAYGEETCPKSKRLHHQMFMYLHKDCCHGKRKLNEMGNWFGTTHCSVKPMRGKIRDNEVYCSKESQLIKHGDEPKQGARGDIDEAKESIMKGDMTADEIAVENPGFFHQYGRTLDRIEAIALRQQYRTWMTKGIWYTGPTGSGKSHAVFEGFDPATHYVKDLSTEWWDGYKGQPVVILNEFRGSDMKYQQLLDLIDKWPTCVKWRNKESVPFLAKEVRIASILDPEEAYPGMAGTDSIEQLRRRVSVRRLNKRKLESEQKCS